MEYVFKFGYCIVCLGCLAASSDVIELSPIAIFSASTTISIIAGTAALYRENRGKKIKAQDFIEHALNMGVCGASLSMLLYAWLEPKPLLEWSIIGIVGLISLGGMSSINFVIDKTTLIVGKLLGGKDAN